MQNYKDKNGNVHFLDSSEFEFLLPIGCVKISHEQACALNAPTADQMKAVRKSEIISRLGELDILSLRPLRSIVAGTSTDDDRAKIAVFETEVSELRAELAALN